MTFLLGRDGPVAASFVAMSNNTMTATKKDRDRRFEIIRVVAPLLMCIIGFLMTLQTDRTEAAWPETLQKERANKPILSAMPARPAADNTMRATVSNCDEGAPSSGESAIRELRQQGAYESLRQAIAAKHPDVKFAGTLSEAGKGGQSDPLAAALEWPLQYQLLASNAAALDHFGSAVAISGNTAIIGTSDGRDDRGVFH